MEYNTVSRSIRKNKTLFQLNIIHVCVVAKTVKSLADIRYHQKHFLVDHFLKNSLLLLCYHGIEIDKDVYRAHFLHTQLFIA